jgi:hypothetical protein
MDARRGQEMNANFNLRRGIVSGWREILTPGIIDSIGPINLLILASIVKRVLSRNVQGTSQEK